MYKKTITYEDFDGVKRTEDFYFNLTESELFDMTLTTEGSFADRLKNIVKGKNTAQLVRIFKGLIEKSYGVKSDDGKHFVKNKEVFDEFKSTMAYDSLFMELGTNEESAWEFIKGIVPAKMRENLPKDPMDAIKKSGLNEEDIGVADFKKQISNT